MATRTRRIVKFSVATLLLVVCTLIIVEVLMTVLDPYLFRGFFQYDPDLGFRARPYTRWQDALTNEFGFNDIDYPLQKPAGIYRVLVIGDSFNWAGGLEGNYATLLERKFEDHYKGHKIDVINAGYPMTHTAEQLVILKKYGLQYNPDLVVLGFDAGNDFLDADPHRKRIVVNDSYIDIDKRRERRMLGYPIVSESRLLLFMRQKYRIFRETVKVKEESQRVSGKPEKQGDPLSEKAFLKGEKAKLEFFSLKASREGRFQENISYIFRSISTMDAMLRSRNIKLVVAIYPAEFQVNQTLASMIFARFNLRKEDYDLALAQRLLKRFLESNRIPYVDLLDRFRTEGQIRELYLFRNTHWNGAGNQLAANVLSAYLVKFIDVSSPLKYP